MKTPSPFLRGYLTALRKHLKDGASSKTDAAGALGARALKLGLGTPDIAKIHMDSLFELQSEVSGGASAAMIRSAGRFLAGAIVPIEDSHRALRNANFKLKEKLGSLDLRRLKLVEANAALKREIGRRKTVEAGLKAGEQECERLLGESHLEQEALRMFSRQLISAQEDERKRISRDLHDVVAQSLTGINFRLAEINLQTTAGAKKLLGKIAATQKLLEKSMEVVHHFAAALRPSVLDDLGLIPAIRSHLVRFTGDTGIDIDFTADEQVETLDGTSRTVLYRVVQEALANIDRHADARRAEVRIELNGNFVRLEIADRGKGFECDASRPAGSAPRLGLLGMRERVEMVGGRFHVSSTPTKGTTIRVEVPRHKASLVERSPAKPSEP